MSKRAEERALEAYLIEIKPLVYQDLIDSFGGKTEIDVNTYPRCLFQQGYEQAEKDTIERAIKWLKENWREYVWTTDNGIPHFGHWENDFRKALEEE